MRQQQEAAAAEVLGELSSTSCLCSTSCNDGHTNETRQQQQPQQQQRSSSRINVQRRPWRKWQHSLVSCIFLVGVVLVFIPSVAFVESREVVHHLRHVVNDRDTLLDPSSSSSSVSTTGVTAHSIRHRRLHPHNGDGRRSSSSEASAPRDGLEFDNDNDEEEWFDKDPNSPMAYANVKGTIARSTSTQKAKYIGQRGTSCRDINGRHGKEGYHYVTVGRNNNGDSNSTTTMVTLQECIDLCTSNDFSNGGRNSLEQQEERASGDGPEPSSLLFTTSNANSEFCYGFQFFMVNGTTDGGSSMYDRPNWGPRRRPGFGGGNIHQQGVTGGVFGKHQSKNGCRLWKRPIESIQRKRGKGTSSRQYCFRKLGAPSLPVVVQSRTHMNASDEGAATEESGEDLSSDQDCPEPRLAPCTREYDPVICDYNATTTSKMIQCEYDNTCIAKLAGFIDIETQCIHQIDLVVVDEEGTSDTNNSTTEVVSKNNETNDVNEDVLFEEDSELPAAQARTTYDATNQCPKPALKPCTREYDPVYCEYQGISCKYSNACIARLAGFQNVFKNCVRERDYDESAAEKKRKRQKRKKRTAAQKNKWQVKPRTVTTNTTDFDTNNNSTVLFGNVTDCPLPDPDGYCPLIYQPVLCLGECRYSNGCFAQLAGFNVSLSDQVDNDGDIGDDCILVEEEDVSIETAVQIEEDSSPAPTTTCPPPDFNGICPLVYNPVVCTTYSNTTSSSNATTTCEYSNDCFAALAGWNIQEHCIQKCIDPYYFGVGSDENSTSVVPKLDDTESCGLHNTFNPVICGHSRHKIEPQYDNQKGCLYDNKCMAKQMGFVEEAACELYCPGVILKEEGTFIEAYSFGYPSPGSDMQSKSTLTMSLDECLNDHSNTLGNSGPVVCGQIQCQYDNLCYATIGAGFDQDQCTSLLNNEEDDEGEEDDDDTRVTATMCPTPDPNGFCPLLYQPVVCSSASNSTATSNTTVTCDYSNQCFAKLAGWTEEECIPKQCIDENYFFNITDASNTTTTTTTSCDEGIHNVYNPIICGPSENRTAQVYDHQQKGCIFNNKCEAEQSGLFSPPVDCEFHCPGIITAEIGTPVEAQAIGLGRPQPFGTTGTCPECTRQALDDCLYFLLQITPVRCGVNNCLYDNICLATVGAGFDQDQCIFIS